MALPLLVLAVALVLVLLAAALVVLVKLVLWLSLARTLLALAAAALYWFVASRRRRYAKGFYSCSQVPAAETAAAVCDPRHSVPTAEAAEANGVIAASLRQLADAVVHDATVADTVAAVEEAAVGDAETVTQETDESASTGVDTVDGAQGVKVSPVRRRSLRLPAPLVTKHLGDPSSPSLSATESEDDDEELARSFASSSRSSMSATSPVRGASVARAPAAPVPAARKIRPRSSSSSSGFSVANRKRLVGSPVRQPLLLPQPRSSTPSPSHTSTSASARPHPSSLTPVRNRRSATIASNSSSGMSTSHSSSGSSGGVQARRNVFGRRSAASERELMQEKMASDGYWIGDFRPERQLVARRSFLSNNGGGNGTGSGNTSARSSPRAV